MFLLSKKLPRLYDLKMSFFFFFLRMVRQRLEELCIQELPWPPKGADFNIIENVWGLMKQQLARRQLHGASKDLLWEAVQEEWTRLQGLPGIASTLYASLPARARNVVMAGGAFARH